MLRIGIRQVYTKQIFNDRVQRILMYAHGMPLAKDSYSIMLCCVG